MSYWGPSVKLVAKPKFLDMLKSFDINKCPAKVYEKIR